MDPCFRKKADGSLILADTAEARDIWKKNQGKGYVPPMSESYVKEYGIKLCLMKKGNPKIESDLLGCYKMQFGKYQDQTFKWILENAPGYAGYLVFNMEKDRPDESARYLNKLAFKKYVMHYKEGRELVEIKKNEKTPKPNLSVARQHVATGAGTQQQTVEKKDEEPSPILTDDNLGQLPMTQKHTVI